MPPPAAAIPTTLGATEQQQQQPPPPSVVLPNSSSSCPSSQLPPPSTCFSCQSSFAREKAAYKCGKCCALFIHESLHTCPKCACSREQIFRSGGSGAKVG